jgi:hypothetical protein
MGESAMISKGDVLLGGTGYGILLEADVLEMRVVRAGQGRSPRSG